MRYPLFVPSARPHPYLFPYSCWPFRRQNSCWLLFCFACCLALARLPSSPGIGPGFRRIRRPRHAKYTLVFTNSFFFSFCYIFETNVCIMSFTFLMDACFGAKLVSYQTGCKNFRCFGLYILFDLFSMFLSPPSPPSSVCLVGENPTCSAPGIVGMRGSTVIPLRPCTN